jgi:hypothetical protein
VISAATAAISGPAISAATTASTSASTVASTTTISESTAAAAATAASASKAASPEAAVIAATSAAAVVLALLGVVDLDLLAVDRDPVQVADRVRSALFIGHRHEGVSLASDEHVSHLSAFFEF